MLVVLALWSKKKGTRLTLYGFVVGCQKKEGK